MPQLFNIQTKQPEYLDDNAANLAISQGTHVFEPNTRVNAFDLENNPITLPSDKVKDAVANGYRLETDKEAAVRQFVQDNEGVEGAVKVFAGQALDEFLMGIPELVSDYAADPLTNAKREALKKEFEYSNTAGGLAGFLGSLAYGGPIGGIAAKAGERIAKTILEKSAGAVSKAAAERAATSIIGRIGEAAKTTAQTGFIKGAGGVAEGLAFAAPRAITEAAFGDFDAAGETLAGGGLIGGGVASILGGSVAGVKKLRELTQDVDKAQIARKIAKTITGVPEDDIQHYIERTNQVDAAGEKGLVGIKSEIDESFANVEQNLNIAKQNFQTAENAYKQNINQAKRGLEEAKKTVDLDDITKLQDSLNDAKAVLGADSENALNILVESGTTVQRPKLLGFLTQLQNDMRLPDAAGRPTVELTPTIKSAVADLEGMKAQIKQMAKDIDGATAKQILKQLDNFIQRPKEAGAFFDQTDRMLSTFRGFIDDTLKQNEQYAAAMKPLAEKTRVLKDLSQKAGTPDRAKSFFKRAANQKEFPVDAKLLEDYDRLFETDFGATVAQRRRNIDLLDQLRAAKKNESDIDRFLTENLRDSDKALLAARDEAAQKLKVAEENYNSIKMLSPRRTENVIGRGKLSIEDAKQLENLATLLNLPSNYFTDLVGDYRVWASFGKERTQGTRRTFLAATAGSVAGSLGGVGPFFGALAGAATDVYGGALVKDALQNANIRGVLYTEKAAKAIAQKIDSLDDILLDMSNGITPKVETLAIAGTVKLTGDRKAKAVQLELLSKRLAELNADPNFMQNQIATMSQPLSDSGAPQVATAMSKTMMQAINYLQIQMPKPLKPNSPYSPKIEYIPSDAEMAAFEQKLEITQNPMAVLIHFANGTLTSNHIDALNKVYPKIGEALRKKLKTQDTKKEIKPLKYKDRIKLGMLLSFPVDDTFKNIKFYQNSYTGEDKTIDKSLAKNVNIAEGTMSESQRLMS